MKRFTASDSTKENDMGAFAAAYPLMTGAMAGAAATTVMSAMAKPATVTGAAPTVTPPKTMPTPGDAADRANKRMSLKQQRERQGRASTILTDSAPASDKLGA